MNGDDILSASLSDEEFERIAKKKNAELRKMANWKGIGLGDDVQYKDLLHGFDGTPHIRKSICGKVGMDLTKAQAISGLSAGSTDLSLIPLNVLPTIQDITIRKTPLVEIVPRFTNYGNTVQYNRYTKRGVGGWKGENPVLVEEEDTFERKSENIKYLYEVGAVTGPMLAASKAYLSQEYVDALNLEIRNKTITMRYQEEDSILNGHDTNARLTTDTPAPYGAKNTLAGKEIMGFRNRSGLQTLNMSGAAISIPKLREGIRRARTANGSAVLGQSDPDLCVTDYTTYDAIKGLMMDYQRFVDKSDLSKFGVTSFGFDGINFVPSRFAVDSAAAREIEVMSSETLQMRVLQDATYDELAKTTDAIRFYIKLYEAFVCTVPEYNCKIYGIA